MRNKKHNHKTVIITGLLLFIGISVVVINAQDMQTISRVKFSNQKIVINQGDTEFSNTEVGFNNAGSLNNHNIGAGNTGVNINNFGNINNANGSINNTGDFQNAGGFENQNVNFGNQGEFNNTNGHFNNSGNFNNRNANWGNQGDLNNNGSFNNTGSFDNNGGFNNSGGNYNNQNGNYNNYGQFDNSGNNLGGNGNNFGGNGGNFGNNNQGFGNQDYRNNPNKYKYQDIDWSTWKSNFVNRILDDSMYIKSLDLYGLGTWFYYSFTVTDKGEIQNVTVFSFYLNEADKKQVRDLIRSYAHKPITIFPKDSRRSKAKVKAIMLLGDTESKSDASNFNDIEKIKIKY